MEMFYNFYLLILIILLTPPPSRSEESFVKNSDHIEGEHEHYLLTLRINESINREKEERNRVKNEMISAIKSRDFARADSLIPEFSPTLIRINLIVMVMYEEDNSTFPVLMEYAEQTQNDGVAYHIIDELYICTIGMANNITDHGLLNKLCKIFKMFQERILNSQISEDHKTYVQSVIDSSLIPKITREAAILLKQNQHNATFYEILNRIYDVNETLVNVVLVEFINSAYSDGEFRNLLTKIWAIEWVPQRVTALTALYWGLTKYNNNRGEFSLEIAYYFYLFKNSIDYSILMDDQKDEFQKCIDHMPTSVQHLYFSQRVRFINNNNDNGKEHYLIVNDEKSAKMVLYEDASTRMAGCWQREVIYKDEFRFINMKYDKQFLSADPKEPGFWESGRDVITTTLRDCQAHSNLIWKIGLYSTNLAITSTNYGKNICYYFNFENDLALQDDGDFLTNCRWIVRGCD